MLSQVKEVVSWHNELCLCPEDFSTASSWYDLRSRVWQDAKIYCFSYCLVAEASNSRQTVFRVYCVCSFFMYVFYNLKQKLQIFIVCTMFCWLATLRYLTHTLSHNVKIIFVDENAYNFETSVVVHCCDLSGSRRIRSSRLSLVT